MKKENIYLFIALLLCVLYPVNLLAVIVGFGVVFGLLLLKNESEIIKKVMQPGLLMASVLAVKGVFALIMGFVQYIVYLARDYTNFFNMFNAVLEMLLYAYIVAFIILGVVAILKNKDMPLYGKLVSKIYGEKSRTKAKVIIEEEKDDDDED